MRIDHYNIFGENTDLSANRTLETLDLRSVGDIAPGQTIYAVSVVTTALGAATGTYTYNFEHSDAETSGFAAISGFSLVLPKGSPVGYRSWRPLSLGFDKRYVLSKFVKTGTTSGKATLFLTAFEPSANIEAMIPKAVL